MSRSISIEPVQVSLYLLVINKQVSEIKISKQAHTILFDGVCA